MLWTSMSCTNVSRSWSHPNLDGMWAAVPTPLPVHSPAYSHCLFCCNSTEAVILLLLAESPSLSSEQASGATTPEGLGRSCALPLSESPEHSPSISCLRGDPP